MLAIVKHSRKSYQNTRTFIYKVVQRVDILFELLYNRSSSFLASYLEKTFLWTTLSQLLQYGRRSFKKLSKTQFQFRCVEKLLSRIVYCSNYWKCLETRLLENVAACFMNLNLIYNYISFSPLLEYPQRSVQQDNVLLLLWGNTVIIIIMIIIIKMIIII